MSAPQLCLYCDSPLDGSVEHLLLSAIGGRKKSRRVLCSRCNGRFGSTIDRELAEQLQIFSNILSIKSGRGDDAPTIKGGTLSTGGRWNLMPGGRPQPLDVTIRVEESDGIKKTTIRAPVNKKHVIKQILEGLASKEGKTLADLGNSNARLESVYLEESLMFDFDIGGMDSLRAVAKMALNLLAAEIGSDRVRTDEFARIRALVTRGEVADQALVNFDYRNEFPEPPNLSISAGWSHRIVISANQATGVVAGFVRLYGALRFSVILANAWNGPSLTYAYIVDPVAGQHEERRGFPPSFATWEQLAEHRPDKPAFQNAMEQLAPLVRERMNESAIHQIVDDSITEAFADLNEGDLITQAHINKAASLVANRFGLWRSRRSSSRPMDVDEILGEEKKRG